MATRRNVAGLCSAPAHLGREQLRQNTNISNSHKYITSISTHFQKRVILFYVARKNYNAT